MKEFNLQKSNIPEDISRIRKTNNPDTLLEIFKKEADADIVSEKAQMERSGTVGIIQNLRENIETFEIILKEAEENKDVGRYNLLIDQLGKMRNKMLEIISSN